MTRIRRYREVGYPVPHKDLRQIRIVAHQMHDWTAGLFPGRGSAIPVIEVIEYMGSWGSKDYPDYEILEDEEFPGFAANFSPDQMLFRFSLSVWDAASRGDGAARIDVAHEIGHCALNHPSLAFGRQFAHEIVIKELDSEWQANTFADEYLMDCRLMTRTTTVSEVMADFMVDEASAARRIHNLMREGCWRSANYQ